MGDWDVRIRPDGSAMVVGVDTGDLTVVKWTPGEVLVLHEDGHKFWAGLGRPWRYAPAQFRVLVPTSGGRWRHLAEFPTRWREATR